MRANLSPLLPGEGRGVRAILPLFHCQLGTRYSLLPLLPFSPSPLLPFSPSPLLPSLPFSPSPLLPFSPSPLLPFSPSPLLPFSPSPLLPFSPSPLLPFSPLPLLPFSPALHPLQLCPQLGDGRPALGVEIDARREESLAKLVPRITSFQHSCSPSTYTPRPSPRRTRRPTGATAHR